MHEPHEAAPSQAQISSHRSAPACLLIVTIDNLSPVSIEVGVADWSATKPELHPSKQVRGKSGEWLVDRHTNCTAKTSANLLALGNLLCLPPTSVVHKPSYSCTTRQQASLSSITTKPNQACPSGAKEDRTNNKHL
jgi:hypothetical protein